MQCVLLSLHAWFKFGTWPNCFSFAWCASLSLLCPSLCGPKRLKEGLEWSGYVCVGRPIIERLNVVFFLVEDGKAALLHPASYIESQFSEKKTQFHQSNLTVECSETSSMNQKTSGVLDLCFSMDCGSLNEMAELHRSGSNTRCCYSVVLNKNPDWRRGGGG